MEIYHRYFVQYMLKNGVSTVNNALTYCKHVSKGKIDSMTNLKTLIIGINREVSKQFYKIVFSVCEVTNRNLVVWLNTKNDDISKHQISYTPIELEYFQAVLQELLVSEDHRLSFITCINISSTLTSQFSRDSGQNALNKWIKAGYYVNRQDYIFIGPRTILEFTAYLRSNCPESICNLCSELVFTGKKCSHCDKVLHSHCLSTYLSSQTICPCCQNEWVHASEDQSVDTADTYDDTYDNSAMRADDEDTTNNYTESRSQSSPVLGSTRSRRNLRSTHSDDYISDIDEPGPSTRKRHR